MGALRPDPADAWASANGGAAARATPGALPATPTPRVAARAILTVRAPSTPTRTVAAGACLRRRDGAHQRLWRQHLRSVWGRSDAHLCLGGDRLSPAWLRRLLRLSRVSPAGRGAVLFGVGLLRLRSRCRCRGWRDRRRLRAASAAARPPVYAPPAAPVAYAALPPVASTDPSLTNTNVGARGLPPPMAPTASTTAWCPRRDRGTSIPAGRSSRSWRACRQLISAILARAASSRLTRATAASPPLVA